jgi:hypothetical protein
VFTAVFCCCYYQRERVLGVDVVLYVAGFRKTLTTTTTIISFSLLAGGMRGARTKYSDTYHQCDQMRL